MFEQDFWNDQDPGTRIQELPALLFPRSLTHMTQSLSQLGSPHLQNWDQQPDHPQIFFWL